MCSNSLMRGHRDALLVRYKDDPGFCNEIRELAEMTGQICNLIFWEKIARSQIQRRRMS